MDRDTTARHARGARAATSGSKQSEIVAAPPAVIQQRIAVIRGRQVLLDEQLADLYGVQTKVLVQQVKRNIGRFPDDFMFQLTATESRNLRSQIVTSRSGHGGRRTKPYAFTERA